jgi:aspartate/methionine/tyrosine aminotransferase
MEWAKSRPRARVDLAGSNLLACTLEDLPGAREALELSGESPDGYPPLVAAIAARYGVEPENVATSGGCSGANFLVCAALLDSGDEALIESPAYDPLIAAVRMLGGKPRFFARRVEEDFALDVAAIEEALTPSTRLVIVSNPHNPSGVLAGDESMAALSRLAERTGVPVLVDEVYLDTVRGRPIAPAATRSPLLISTNSLTKAYGLSTLRCGWSLAAPEITRRIRRARDVVDVNGPILAERLALVAMQHIGALHERARRLIEANRPLFAAFLERQPALQCAPSATTIAFPRFREGESAAPFVEKLWNDDRVAIVPGSFFEMPAHFRVSLGGATEALRDGLDAMDRCLRTPPAPA